MRLQCNDLYPLLPAAIPYFVYLICSLDGRPLYVGASRYRYRLNGHEKDEGGPKYIVKAGLTQDEAYDLESELIAFIGVQPNGTLVNKATRRNMGWRHSEEWIKRHTEKFKGQVSPLRGRSRVFSAEHLENLRLSRQSLEYREKLSAVAKGRPSPLRGTINALLRTTSC